MRWTCAVLCLLITGGMALSWEKKVSLDKLADVNTLILPALKNGKICPDVKQPGLKDILRILPRRPAGMANQFEITRRDFAFLAEKIVDRFNPPRFYPLVGRAQLHQVHWKCTVKFTETTKVQFPFPFVVRKRRSEVIYIDKDHLHLAPSKKTRK